ncbi:MAG: flagellar M-ring protein FliF [Deltaproteobacteria bacterium]|nr:flagellar M-ring protein FliF [Deltaproteobacteria bacterium]
MEPLVILGQLKNLVSMFQGLSTRAQILIGVTALALVGGTIGAVYLSQGRPQKYVFTNLTPEDGAAAATQLQQAGIPFQLDSGGTAVSVPEDNVFQARMLLANAGLPRAAGVGFELFDKGDIGVSEMTQRVNLQRALEGELARTIGALSELRSARVHLSVPQRAVLARDQANGSAAVVVHLQPGRHLTDAQVAGIRRLVSSSMVGLKADAVSVVDETGALLGATDDVTARLSEHHKLERQMEERITSLLTASVGEGRIVTRVGLEIDNTEEDVVQKVYDPDGVVLNSERRRTQARTEGGQNQVIGAAPRDPSNPAAGDGGGSVDTANANDESRTWEISNTQTRSVRRGPRIKRLSVAILVDAPDGKPLPPEKLKGMSELAKNVVSFDLRRGDTIEISSAQFVRPKGLDDDQQKDEDKPFISSEVVLAIVGVGLLAALVGFVLLNVRRKRKNFEVESQRTSLLMPGKTIAELEATLDQALLPPVENPADTGDGSYSVVTEDDNLLARARQLLAQNPHRARIIISSWLSTEPTERGSKNVY